MVQCILAAKHSAIRVRLSIVVRNVKRLYQALIHTDKRAVDFSGDLGSKMPPYV